MVRAERSEAKLGENLKYGRYIAHFKAIYNMIGQYRVKSGSVPVFPRVDVGSFLQV